MNRDPSVFDAAPRFEQSPLLGDPSLCFVHCMTQNNRPEQEDDDRTARTREWTGYCASVCQHYAEDPAVESGWRGAVDAALSWPTSPALGIALSDPYLNFAPAALGGSAAVWGGRWRGVGRRR